MNIVTFETGEALNFVVQGPGDEDQTQLTILLFGGFTTGDFFVAQSSDDEMYLIATAETIEKWLTFMQELSRIQQLLQVTGIGDTKRCKKLLKKIPKSKKNVDEYLPLLFRRLRKSFPDIADQV